MTTFRFEVARHLITATGRGLDDVAEAAGFAHASHLSRVFLERAGMRPGGYRRALGRNGRWPPSEYAPTDAWPRPPRWTERKEAL